MLFGMLQKDPYALHAAAWRGQAELFMRLLEVGAKANKLDKVANDCSSY